ncbi:EamA family transporter [Chitinophagaceae bacterium LB-8]|uniref:EamA family transporter n=1 Tax=Paraflavisolibacter caeni TaxID=2982496 RepID=A0A9X2XWI3_9BACT|nr:EamA family transporter [Paraflavisolibacter caeni]MCU7550541.1 EamA family transporter [Paraflavisolibacter caeni]
MTSILLTSIAVLLRILSNPLGNVFQKQLTKKGHHPLVVNFLTYFILSAGCIFLAIDVKWSELPSQFWIYSLLGGLAGGIGNGFLVKALEHGDLSVLGPINSYKSVVGIIVGIFLLGELPNLWGALGMALIIYGSYYVLDTTEDRFSWGLLKRKEIQYRIWAMVLTAIEAVFIKKVILASSTVISFISWCWFGTLFSFLLLLFYRVKISSRQKGITFQDASKYLYLVFCIGTMQFTTNYVFDHMEVGYALSLFQLSTIVSVLLGYRIFQETNIRQKLLGSAIMIAGSILIILLKSK